jgi:hypothetical protein
MIAKINRPAGLAIAALLLTLLPVLAQNSGSPFPEGDATKVQDNDRVVTWDVTWAKGKSTGMHKLEMDQVSVTLTDGAIKTSKPDGTWGIEEERFGSVRFESKGTAIKEEGASDTPCRQMVFQLKDYVPDPWPVREGISAQFPRINTVKLLETDRIIVWDQVWKPGEQVALHAHYHRTATVFLSAGTIHAKPENSADFSPPFSRKFGEVMATLRYSPDAHVEEYVSGSPRAIWIEFIK